MGRRGRYGDLCNFALLRIFFIHNPWSPLGNLRHHPHPTQNNPWFTCSFSSQICASRWFTQPESCPPLWPCQSSVHPSHQTFLGAAPHLLSFSISKGAVYFIRRLFMHLTSKHSYQVGFGIPHGLHVCAPPKFMC